MSVDDAASNDASVSNNAGGAELSVDSASFDSVSFTVSDGEIDRSFEPVRNGTSMEEFAYWQSEKVSNDPATGLEESDSVVFVIHQSEDDTLGSLSWSMPRLTVQEGKSRLKSGLSDTAIGSPHLALDIRDAGDSYDLETGSFHFLWSAKWADFVGIGDIGKDACMRIQATLLDGIDSVKVVDGATLSVLNISDPLGAFSICASGQRDGDLELDNVAETAAVSTDEDNDADSLELDSRAELPASCLEILANDDAAQSGWYDLQFANAIEQVYCDMESDGGGWTGLADVVSELDGCDGFSGASTTDFGACEVEDTTAALEIVAPGPWQEVRAR